MQHVFNKKLSRLGKDGLAFLMGKGGAYANKRNDECEFICGLSDMGGIAIDNARMYDHLKADHEKLIEETHRWFEFGKVS